MRSLAPIDEDLVRRLPLPLAQLYRRAHNGVQEVFFHPGGELLASASKDRTVRVWDVTTGLAVSKLEGHLASVWSVAYHPSGKWLLSSDAVGAVKVWDAATNKELTTMRGHTGSIGNIAVSPDGSLSATAGTDRTARLWDIRFLDADVGRRVAQSEQSQWWAWDARKAVAAMKAGYLADAVFLTSRAIDLNSQPAMLANLYKTRGGVYAEGNHFAEADADFARSLELDPTSAETWTARVLIAWKLGGKNGYVETCGQMLARFANPATSKDAQHAAWACSLLPGAVSDYQQVVKLAEAAAAKGSSFEPTVLGAVYYRAGRFEDAAKRLNDAVGPKANLTSTWVGYYLAMTQYKLGHADDAKLWLSRAIAHSDQAFKDDSDFRSGGRPYRWIQRWAAQILRSEAEALIQGEGK
jgi:tetratricopeptide (TPR) repeat protein